MQTPPSCVGKQELGTVARPCSVRDGQLPLSPSLQKSKLMVESRGRAAGRDFGAAHKFPEVVDIPPEGGRSFLYGNSSVKQK